MKILILDKDGVLNPEAFKPAVKWGFRNLSPVIMIKILLNYVIFKKFNDSDMEKLEDFYSENLGRFTPSESTVSSVIKLRKNYDRVILLTNNGTGDTARRRIMDEINEFYPKNTFDEIVVQRVGSSKEDVYKKWAVPGNTVTVIDDSPRHIKSAILAGVANVVAISQKKVPDTALVFKNIQDYVASHE